MALEIDVQQGWHDALVELFDIDLSPITNNAADIYYFTNQTKEDGSAIIWQGNEYTPLPIISSGYERNTSGTIAQPSLTVANILGTFSSLVDEYDDLVGAKITRHRTLAKYLDGEPEADALQEFPVDIFYIERKSEETALTITWTLASILDLEGLKLPRRIITQNLCIWKYRSSECGYTGGPLFDERDNILSTVGLSSEAAAVINAYQSTEATYRVWQASIAKRNQALERQTDACSPRTFLERLYDFAAGTYVKGNVATISGVQTLLGEFSRAGRQRSYIDGIRYYELALFGDDAAACSGATAEYNAAVSGVTTAQSNYNTAVANYQAALAALPSGDTLWSLDVCGKRTTSCKLRFPRQALPFGGFPGASLKQS